jgi:nucleotide-binding universal stress UspA family protein
MDKMNFSVLNLTDISEASQIAFAHALRLAIDFGSEITLLHMGFKEGSTQERERFPRVRKTLEQWGYLKKGSSQESVFEQLGIAVKKADAHRMNTLAAIMYYLEDHLADFIVLAAKKKCLPTSIDYRVSTQLIRYSQMDSLIIPEGSDGFVSLEDGTVSLRHILVPIDNNPEPETAINDAAALAHVMGNQLVDITLLHVSDRGKIPAVKLPQQMQCSFKKVWRTGKIADEIIASANELEVDLIAMATHGGNGYRDISHKSVIEQVLQQAPCPVLASVSSVTSSYENDTNN